MKSQILLLALVMGMLVSFQNCGNEQGFTQQASTGETTLKPELPPAPPEEDQEEIDEGQDPDQDENCDRQVMKLWVPIKNVKLITQDRSDRVVQIVEVNRTVDLLSDGADGLSLALQNSVDVRHFKIAHLYVDGAKVETDAKIVFRSGREVKLHVPYRRLVFSKWQVSRASNGEGDELDIWIRRLKHRQLVGRRHLMLVPVLRNIQLHAQ